ncbi:MAG: nucleotidyl transferase AbiEii/AbiGii toxin family protein [Lachnospiraceae bacterium]|nr:nucleotidyl transferase AbiEii/AbiGii toxin family protein [Lachnospiraceae bacterium]
MHEEEPEIIKDYELEPFLMKVQALSRTFIDKLFAVCDYYMNGKPTRNSRHLYDIYKLKDYLSFDENFMILVTEVRSHRAQIDAKVAPSARENVEMLAVAKQLIREEFYENDYNESTLKLITDDISYEIVKENYLKIMKMIFGKSH